MQYKLITPVTGPDIQFSNDRIANFLFEHLDQYGDPKESILKCLEYALSNNPGQGGCVLLAVDESRISGAVVINHTGMAGYIPENILVYIAVDAQYRGQGVGKGLMKK